MQQKLNFCVCKNVPSAIHCFHSREGKVEGMLERLMYVDEFGVGSCEMVGVYCKLWKCQTRKAKGKKAMKK